ncbi:hypothetical protein SmJEL517_g00735 [Synchytrium microbalum]|uniref:Sugar phosphate transporter domain-containing protein n=1 Tax=Synchytrium microbalum TaxID=1806994 RepID=A0A507CHZ5_9FUNG|nr:uncharacterized protein SmJEL517_g00735 [Synchytrium microbalum]TPX37694.1 hypothetical protein SmJEL517_g00735 [Synchytrium microbalum]
MKAARTGPIYSLAAQKRARMMSDANDSTSSLGGESGASTPLNLSDGDLMPPPAYNAHIPQQFSEKSDTTTLPTSNASINDTLTGSASQNSFHLGTSTSPGGIRINIQNNINYHNYNIFDSTAATVSGIQNGLWNASTSTTRSFSARWDGQGPGETIKFVLLCLAWYTSSAITNNLSKQIMNVYQHPVTLTYVQFAMVAFFAFSTAVLKIIPNTTITWPSRHVLATAAPLSLFQVAGHVFSSVALSMVSVSFAHTIKALSPLFTVLMYRFFFEVQYAPRVYFSLLPLTAGVMLVCSNGISFNWIGFLSALAATIIFVTQNIFSKKLFTTGHHHHHTDQQIPTPGGVKKSEGQHKKLDKINLLFYSSFLAFLFMTPLWLYSDGLGMLISHVESSSVAADAINTSSNGGFSVAALFFMNGVAHFGQNLLAFWLLSLVSPVTYSVASLLKRIFVIVSSIFWFSDSVTSSQFAGMCLTFFGLWMYQKAKQDITISEIVLEKEEFRLV